MREAATAPGLLFSNTNLGMWMLLIVQLMMVMLVLVLLLMMMMLILMMPHYQRSMMTQMCIGILVHGMMMVLSPMRATAAQGHCPAEGAACGRLAGQQVLYLSLVSARRAARKEK